jgi:transposase-like protein
MSKRIFSQQQINEILKNNNVIKCGIKSITYNKHFKIKAVKQYCEEGMPPKEIFKQAEFNLDLIGQDTPNSCLGRWKRVFRKRGIERLSTDGRGKGKGVGMGRPRLRGMTDTEKIKKLELTVAYLKAENDFLIKLRAKKAE